MCGPFASQGGELGPSIGAPRRAKVNVETPTFLCQQTGTMAETEREKDDRKKGTESRRDNTNQQHKRKTVTDTGNIM